MKTLIKLEEAAMFLLSICLLSRLPYAWWWWLVWILAPDVSMLAYLGGNRVGAIGYNFVHHKAVAIIVYLTGLYTNTPALEFAGLILFGHSCMDRGMGYGLKYFSGFHDTHLGKIGREAANGIKSNSKERA
ncbi:MAG TPA: DUF4260 domain-containing protein [Puia sp.]|jgi:hypothetical protein|nr:DUF4260 domain-containing protein [Puia sp.]